MMITAGIYVFDGLADWEIGLLSYEMNTRTGNRVVTFGDTRAAIRTGGGLAVTPDKTIDDLRREMPDLIILPGGEFWESDVALPGLKSLVAEGIKNGKVVGAICGAVLFMARNGFLQGVRHTGGGKEYLLEKAGVYPGKDEYVEEKCVSDKGIVTADGRYFIEFAAEVLLAGGIYDREIGEFLGFWRG